MKENTIKSVGFESVSLLDGFWKERYETAKSKTVDAVYTRFDETGRFDALKYEWKEGMPNKPHIFWDSDITKWIEGAAYFLQKQRDPVLESKIDELVNRMAEHQAEDGYLNSYFQQIEPDAIFTRRTDHELYCAGHLVEGAIAYYNATGKRKMLDVAIRFVDLIDRVFRIEHSAQFDTPGHEEIELALIKLYRFTGEERYKLLAEYFINTRGTSDRDSSYKDSNNEYMQSHIPVRKQKTADGHAVRALYLYAGMADLAKVNNDEELQEVCKTLFSNIIRKRIHITGGVGSTHRGEAFTFDYDLPEYRTYNETCASIALALFCRRMWLLEANGIYADYAENALYNTILSGISLSGDMFYYENPLAVSRELYDFNESRPEALKEHLPIIQRVKVFECSCCPPNLVRFFGSIGDYAFSSSDDTVYLQCYMGAEADVDLKDISVHIKEETGYPYDGKIKVTAGTAGRYKIAVRIPNWCSKYEIFVNGTAFEDRIDKGYVFIDREWCEQDEVIIHLSLDARITEANPCIWNLCGKIAVQRGPVVYCAEEIDQQAVKLRDIRISRSGKFHVVPMEMCGISFPSLEVEGSVREQCDELYYDSESSMRKVVVKLIPYFAWANRGVTDMSVWFIKE